MIPISPRYYLFFLISYLFTFSLRAQAIQEIAKDKNLTNAVKQNSKKDAKHFDNDLKPEGEGEIKHSGISDKFNNNSINAVCWSASLITAPTCSPGCDGKVVVTLPPLNCWNTPAVGNYNVLVGAGCGTVTGLVNVGPGTYTLSGFCGCLNSYNIMITDQNGFLFDSNGISIVGLYVATPNFIPLAVSVNSITCPNICSGSISVSFFGGTPPYSFTVAAPNVSPSFTTSSGIVSRTGLCAGVVTITAKDPANCTSTYTHSILSSSFTVSALASSASVCAGNTITLTGSGAITYTWSGGVVNASPFIPTTTSVYTLSGSNASGCIANATVPIIVYPLPTITINQSGTEVCLGNTVILNGSGASSYTILSPSGTYTNGTPFAPISTSSYSVIGTDANGCKNTAVTSVSVVPTPPQFTLSANPATSVCLGNTIALSATGTSTYSWMGGILNNVPFVPAASGAYTVNASNVCGSLQKTISVSVLALPTLAISSDAIYWCLGETHTLSVSGANSYSWSNGSNTSQIVLTPASATVISYSVTGADQNACKNTAVVTKTVSECTSISYNGSESDFVDIYPNPFQTKLTIILKSNVDNASVFILDMTSRLIWQKEMTESPTTLNMDGLSAGVYIVIIKHENLILKKRLIKLE